MIWPPVKAWTSKFCINGHKHFVVINYGGKLLDRWALMMSVLDSSVVVKVSFTQLANPSNWVSGWNENNCKSFSKSGYKKGEIKAPNSICLSNDSGLIIPINSENIRPWFNKA